MGNNNKKLQKKIRKKRFNTAKEYGLNFLNFIANKNPLFPKRWQEAIFATSLRAYYEEIIKNHINSTVKKIIGETNQNKLDLNKIKSIVQDTIKKSYLHLTSKKTLPNYSKKAELALEKKYSKLIEKTIEKVFQQLPIPVVSRRELKKIAVYTVTRDVFSNLESGIVVAGFGEKENFPSLISFNVDSVFDNKLKYKIDKAQVITVNESAAIIPFAQSEMVATFMEGIDPALQDFFQGYLTELFTKYPDMIADNIISHNDKEKKELNRLLKKSLSLLYFLA